ncbi:MAG: class II aldolase/adducin family protein [Anaerolineales bacterium]|nr:class II aldolase/adducin family protein [Anaerolineales bacterium]
MSELQFYPDATERELRMAIVACGRICYEHGLVMSNDGNISARLGRGKMLITPSGLCKGRMELRDLVIVDETGNLAEAVRGRRASSETSMHLEAYRQRPDIRAIIHAHPVYATTLTVAGVQIPNDVLPEVLMTMGDIPTAPYAMPSSHEDADVIRDLIRDHDAVLLRQHGSLTVGCDLEDALIKLERLEHVAEVVYRAMLLGRVNRIPEDMLKRLMQIQAEILSSHRN